MQRLCKRCDTIKPLIAKNFYANPNSAGGFSAHCNECEKKRRQERAAAVPSIRTCTKCEQTKPKAEFVKFDRLCKRCKNKNYTPIPVGQQKTVQRKTRPDGTVNCTLCMQWLPSDSFWKNPSTKAGLLGTCIPCTQARRRKYMENPEYRAMVARYQATRREAVKLQTPPWYDQSQMEPLYAEAQRLTLTTGKMHHVDHIVPLMGELVRGLHVHWNCVVMEGSANIRKGNKLVP
jgi:hypothetical protein